MNIAEMTYALTWIFWEGRLVVLNERRGSGYGLRHHRENRYGWQARLERACEGSA